MERRLVLDTNLLISRLLMPGGTAARAVDKALAEAVVLVSDATMTELADVLSRSKFDRYVSLEDRRRFMQLLGGVVQLIQIQHRIAACRDPRDDMLLDVALNGQAQVLVSGDRDLLALHEGFRRHHGVWILDPAGYLAFDAWGQA